MPRIKPFKALKPSLSNISNIVTRPVEFYKANEVKRISVENPNSFLNLIDPALNNPYQRGSRSSLIYKTIEENLDSFREDDVLVAEEKPAIYIYQVRHDGLVQTGIWTLTHINDYLQGNIKKHELTVEVRELALADYISQTGLDANPVLITYQKDKVIKSVIEKYTSQKPDIDFNYNDGTHHQIWIVNLERDVNKVVNAFEKLPAVYIADGHHRAASMAKMCLQKRKLYYNDEEAGYNFFSTVYMDTDEVKVLPFYRMVKDLASLSEEDFLIKIAEIFDVKKESSPVLPKKLHHFGMYLNSGWYSLIAKDHTYHQHPVDVLDVSILQNYVLNPILKIKDPRTDSKIVFEGGKTKVEKLEKLVNDGKQAVVFTLAPVTVDQIIDVADINGVMPPKSTWIEPKFLVGLLTNVFHR